MRKTVLSLVAASDDAHGCHFLAEIPEEFRDAVADAAYLGMSVVHSPALTLYTEEELKLIKERWAALPAEQQRIMRLMFARFVPVWNAERTALCIPESHAEYAWLSDRVVLIEAEKPRFSLCGPEYADRLWQELSAQEH